MRGRIVVVNDPAEVHEPPHAAVASRSSEGRGCVALFLAELTRTP